MDRTHPERVPVLMDFQRGHGDRIKGEPKFLFVIEFADLVPFINLLKQLRRVFGQEDADVFELSLIRTEKIVANCASHFLASPGMIPFMHSVIFHSFFEQ